MHTYVQACKPRNVPLVGRRTDAVKALDFGAARRIVEPKTTFLGREVDLARLHALFAAGQRLVTVLGPPGSGKTRLALRYEELHPPVDGALFCNLTEARTVVDVCRIAAHALGLALFDEDRSAEVVARLGNKLQGRGEVLVILDNCEPVVADVARVVKRWHEAAPRARFLCTSRELLGLPGGCVHELEPLSVPEEGKNVRSSDAVRLFVDRAKMARNSYVLADAQAPIVAEIVRQLDGLPLAIELAAARMSVLGEKALLERLGQRFDLLAGGSRDASVGQRSLREAIESSWRLLEPWERAALAQASVFRDGFTLDSAEAFIDLSPFDGAPSTLDVLQALHDKSLLRTIDANGERSFRMYETIRAFAEEKREGTDLALARPATLVVGPDASWFQPPGRERVDIHRGRQLRRLLGALVRKRLETPGEVLSVDELLRSAWPGERFAVQRSAAMRVYVRLAKLRSLGLRNVIRSVGNGYLLDPNVIVEDKGSQTRTVAATVAA